MAIVAAPIYDELLPTEEGHYVLCVLGSGEGPSGSFLQEPRHATVVAVLIDTAPPNRPPAVSIQKDVGQGWRFEPHFSPPEYSDLWLKSGRAFEVDCADSAGYEAYRRIPIDIPAEMAPAVVCVQGYDDASNPGAVLRVEIPAQD